MPIPPERFKVLAGVPVHYDRDKPEDYGTRGRPYTFQCTAALKSSLNKCFQELWSKCRLGKAEVITSAGTYVDRPASHHSRGDAFDLDGIFWNNHTFVTKRYLQGPVFYLGVESVLRKHFGVVLDYNYNTDHHDHFHVDNSSPRGFAPTRRTSVLYLQATLTHIFGIPTGIDGQMGSEIRNNAREFLIREHLATGTQTDTPDMLYRKLNELWNVILDKAAQEAIG